MPNAGVCVACRGTGRNSKGGICLPCAKAGRQIVRDAVLAAVNDIFADYYGTGSLPNEDELIATVRWAFSPNTTYAVGYKDDSGGFAGVAGPCPCLNDMLDIVPEEDPFGRNVYVVEFVRSGTRGQIPSMRTVARWRDNRWQVRPGL